VTIATDSGGRQRTLTDGPSLARHAAALAVDACTWVRDEEANAGRVGVADGSLSWIHGPSRWAHER
jgi:hypothetical protein